VARREDVGGEIVRIEDTYIEASKRKPFYFVGDGLAGAGLAFREKVW
jgi:hypothetical protein